jgi:hypothetical protein
VLNQPVAASGRERRARNPWRRRSRRAGFGQLPPKPVEYTPVNPVVVVELDADVAFEQGRWRHPTA